MITKEENIKIPEENNTIADEIKSRHLYFKSKVMSPEVNKQRRFKPCNPSNFFKDSVLSRLELVDEIKEESQVVKNKSCIYRE